ncbi:MAG: glycosyltransferase family 2 protein [Actinomycetota bacterium]
MDSTAVGSRITDDESPLVSVIIPTFGRPEYLSDAVRSVTDQTYRPIELIVVDDNSELAVQLDPIEGVLLKIVRHVRNLGPGAARNSGMAHASGQYVTFLDDDDRLHPDRIRVGVDDIGEAFMHSVSSNRSQRAFEGDMRNTLQHGELPSVTQVLFRRSDLLQFDSTLRVSEDIEWWIRMTDRAVFSRSAMIGLMIRQHDSIRPGVDHRVRARCRTAVLERHYRHLDRRGRSFHLLRAASAELVAGRRLVAARYASMSWLARPSLLAAKIVANLFRRPGRAE